jgi:hypothetical protein
LEKKNDKVSDEIKLIRFKDRTSFSAKLTSGINYRVDFTRGKDSQEIEIELNCEDFFGASEINKRSAIESLIAINKNINDIESYIEFYNRVISEGEFKNSSKITTRTPRARDLSLLDITKNGLLSKYMASVKVDGEQRIFIFHETGIYSVYPGTSDIRVGDIHPIIPVETIIAGEVVNDLFIPFDVICYKGKSQIYEPYNKRLELLYNIEGKQIGNLKIHLKEFYEINPDNFFEINKKILNSDYDYPTDGIIYTPIKEGYFTKGTPEMEEKRILSKVTDIVKYKPPEKLTIDFLVKDGKLFVTDDTDTKIKEFTGTSRYPFTQKNYEIIETIETESIYEFKPLISVQGIIMTPHRKRDDKKFPNKYFVASFLWNTLHDPITIEDMIGIPSTKFVRRYHNSIKKELYDKASGYCIDIGSGAGGDLSKWRNFEKVLAIEPSKDNLKIFQSRNKEFSKDKVEILNVKGEDTIEIMKKMKIFTRIPTNPMYISSMLSLSFFDENNIRKLADTINSIKEYYFRNGGKEFNFIFFFMNYTNPDGLAKYGTVTIKRKGNELLIDIADSVLVHKQKEFIPNFDMLLALTNLTVINKTIADPDDTNFFMSTEEKEFSKFFMYGKAVYRSTFVRSPISKTRGIRFGGIIYAKGDDIVKEIKTTYPGTFSISCISENSFSHSVSKLCDRQYRKSNYFDRLEIANELKNIKVEDWCNKNKISVKLWNGYEWKQIGKYTKVIFLVEYGVGDYEPIVIISHNKYHYVFQEMSSRNVSD